MVCEMRKREREIGERRRQCEGRGSARDVSRNGIVALRLRLDRAMTDTRSIEVPLCKIKEMREREEVNDQGRDGRDEKGSLVADSMTSKRWGKRTLELGDGLDRGIDGLRRVPRQRSVSPFRRRPTVRKAETAAKVGRLGPKGERA